MPVESGGRITADQVDAWLSRIVAQLLAGEQVTYVCRCNNLSPMVDLVAVTNARVLGLETAGGTVEFAALVSEIDLVSFDEDRGSLTVSAGEAVTFTFKSIHRDDLPALRRAVESLTRAGAPAAMADEIARAQRAIRYVGHDGWIEADQDLVVVVRAGASAKGLAAMPARRIPLASISGVRLKAPSVMLQGWLTIGTHGAPAAELDHAAALSDPSTVMFSRKDQPAFDALHGWLQRVASTNTGAGLTTPTGVAAAAATPAPKITRRERSQLRDDFQARALAAARGDSQALAELPAALAETRQHWRQGKLTGALWRTLSAAIDHAAEDDVLTSDEEAHLVALAGALDLDWQELPRRSPKSFERLVICRINDGRPPTLEAGEVSMLLRRGEVAHGTFEVDLMKEVVQREFRGGSSGVSIPLGHGVRFRTGAMRGRSVVVGTSLQTADHGTLTVTSSRAVFSGMRKTLEFRFDKLVDVQQFDDGLRLGVTNRQAASLFRFSSGSSPMIAAALVSHGASAL